MAIGCVPCGMAEDVVAKTLEVFALGRRICPDLGAAQAVVEVSQTRRRKIRSVGDLRS